MKFLLSLSCAAVLFGAACGGTVTTGSGGGATSGSGGAGGGISGVNCSGNNQPMFPTFEKKCTAKSDCLIKLHRTDCCGSEAAIGVSKSDGSRFDKDEKACDAMFPGCGCSSQPTTAEDGKNATMGTIAVECQAGKCLTVVQ